MRQIFQAVERVTGFSETQLRTPSRGQPLIFARWIAAHELYHIGYTLKQVGGLLNRDHSTVIYALKKIRKPTFPLVHQWHSKVKEELARNHSIVSLQTVMLNLGSATSMEVTGERTVSFTPPIANVRSLGVNSKKLTHEHA